MTRFCSIQDSIHPLRVRVREAAGTDKESSAQSCSVVRFSGGSGGETANPAPRRAHPKGTCDAPPLGMTHWRTVALLGLLIATPQVVAADPETGVRREPVCTGTYADDFSALSSAGAGLRRSSRGDVLVLHAQRGGLRVPVVRLRRRGAARSAKEGDASRNGVRLQAAGRRTPFCSRTTTWPAGPWSPTPSTRSRTSRPAARRISESLTLVDDEHDNYASDDIPLTRVVTDPQLDVAGAEDARRPARHAVEDRAQRRTSRAKRRRGARLSAGSLSRDEHRQGHLRSTTTTTTATGTTTTSSSTRCSRRATPGRRCSASRARRASTSWSASFTPATPSGQRAQRRHRHRPSARHDEHAEALAPKPRA